MKIPDTFLLTNCSAERLYFEFAQTQPIYDYHCHLPPNEIAENREFENLSAIWLEGDHYKWRAMRANGVDESLITGGGSPRDKHDAWCATMPYALRNPLYHWSHLELQRYFGIDSTINSNSACSIWEEANSKLPKLRVHDILEQQNVAVVCTTDDPSDSLVRSPSADSIFESRDESATSIPTR
ncbi:MAG: glucuronate isomerase [Fimbriimonadales bacterium]|nr:glucuronate isomerase [Fimbriimonadales bacterium]